MFYQTVCFHVIWVWFTVLGRIWFKSRALARHLPVLGTVSWIAFWVHWRSRNSTVILARRSNSFLRGKIVFHTSWSRWAIKEAAYKALGQPGIPFNNFQVLNTRSGIRSPIQIQFDGKAKEIADQEHLVHECLTSSCLESPCFRQSRTRHVYCICNFRKRVDVKLIFFKLKQKWL